MPAETREGSHDGPSRPTETRVLWAGAGHPPAGYLMLSEAHRLPGVDAVCDLAGRHGMGVVLYDSAHLPGPEVLSRVVFLLAPYIREFGDGSMLEGMTALRAVQTHSAGYDHIIGVLPDGVTLCNAAGTHDAGVAELAVGLAIAHRRDLVWHLDRIRAGAWEGRALAPGLDGARVLVLGYGGIGRAVEQRLSGFDVRLTRVARHARPGPPVVHAMTELPALLPEADVVIVVVPLTDETRGMVDAEFLRALPDGALLVNLSRGAVADTDAVLAEVRRGRLTAALDVTDPEPLPAGHPARHTPGLVVTPHIGGNTEYGDGLMTRLLRRQLEHFVHGEELDNVVRAGR